MKVIAFVPCFQEADILPWTLAHLREQGVTPYVLDNHSTDNTQSLLDIYGVDGELFPEKPTATYDWTAILQRIETLAAESDAAWCMLNDADEYRYWPWPGVTLADGIAKVQASGFNAVNFKVVNFHPTDNAWDGTQDPRTYFRFYEPQSSYDSLPHIKAWQNIGRVDLATTGGHAAWFDGRLVYWHRLISRHYPIRSQAHGERKVFRDRVPRWNAEERARSMHCQYNGIEPGHNFIRDPKDLLEWREELVTA